jgi:hypothetical protein
MQMTVSRKMGVALGRAMVLALGLFAAPAFAVEPGHAAYAAYAGGTAGVALDTPGTLNATSPAELMFKYKAADGTPGEIAVPYAKIRSFELRNDTVHRLGVLPTIAAGLVAARMRRDTVTITYADPSDAVQLAVFQMARRDQTIMQGILRARAPQTCVATQYSPCGREQ